MRIRYKPWARAELEASYFYEDYPENNIGNWKEKFENKEAPIHLELGCGKGSFIAELAFQNQEINYIAIDLVDAMLGLAKRKVEEKYLSNHLKVKNVILVRYDIERINNNETITVAAEVKDEEEIDCTGTINLSVKLCGPLYFRGPLFVYKIFTIRRLLSY